MSSLFQVLHLFGVIFWIGSLLLLTSFLGLVGDEVGVSKERFIFAARRLLNRAGGIGATVAIVFGILLLFSRPELLRHGWMHVKLLLVAGMFVLHGRVHMRINALESHPGSAGDRECHILHGLISVLLLAILVLVIFKPF